jgi:hypothetical protein
VPATVWLPPDPAGPPEKTYHGRVLRDVSLRLLAIAGTLTVLAACGKPPPPPLTGPPQPSASASAGASGLAYPPSGLPGATVPGLPTGGLPPATVPYVPPATLPPVITTRPTATVPTTPAASPAPRCRRGPTAAQLLAVLHGLPGIPDEELKLVDGPYCSGSWQFGQVQIADVDPDSAEQLFVVTTGTPSKLTVIEAGTDVCSTKVQTSAPVGIRVRACGA